MEPGKRVERDFMSVLGGVVMVIRNTKETDTTTLAQSVAAVFTPWAVIAICSGRCRGPMRRGSPVLNNTSRGSPATRRFRTTGIETKSVKAAGGRSFLVNVRGGILDATTRKKLTAKKGIISSRDFCRLRTTTKERRLTIFSLG